MAYESVTRFEILLRQVLKIFLPEYFDSVLFNTLEGFSCVHDSRKTITRSEYKTSISQSNENLVFVLRSRNHVECSRTYLTGYEHGHRNRKL